MQLDNAECLGFLLRSRRLRKCLAVGGFRAQHVTERQPEGAADAGLNRLPTIQLPKLPKRVAASNSSDLSIHLVIPSGTERFQFRPTRQCEASDQSRTDRNSKEPARVV